MKVNYENSGQFFFKNAGISYTVIFNSGGGEYAQASHYHASYELQFPITDGWTLYCEDQSKKLKAGSVCFLSPFVVHHFIPEPNTHDQKKISVKFSLISTQKNGRKTVERISSALNIKSTVCVFTDKGISELFGILSELSEDGYVTEAVMSNILQAIILCTVEHLSKAEGQPSGEGEPQKISDADHKYAILIEDCIATNYKNQSFTLSTLAALINLSERQTERLCQKIFDASFNKLLTRHRMMIARSLISENKASLTEISSLVGYNSYAGFYKRYKELFGVSPKQDV